MPTGYFSIESDGGTALGPLEDAPQLILSAPPDPFPTAGPLAPAPSHEATDEEVGSFLNAVERTGEADQMRQFCTGKLGGDLNNVPGGAIDQIANKYPALVNRTLFGGFQGTIVSVPGPIGGTGTSYMFEEGWSGNYYLVGQQKRGESRRHVLAGVQK